MGRPPSVSEEEAISLIQRYVGYFKSNNFPSNGSKVWMDMSNDLNGRWKPHTVYKHVRENKKGHLEAARHNAGIVVETLFTADFKNNDSSKLSVNLCEPSYSDEKDSKENVNGYEWFDLTLSN